jgi:hypothetical protein
VEPDGEVGNQVLEEIPGETQLGKNQQVEPGRFRAPDPVMVTGQVALPIAKGEIALGESDL